MVFTPYDKVVPIELFALVLTCQPVLEDVLDTILRTSEPSSNGRRGVKTLMTSQRTISSILELKKVTKSKVLTVWRFRYIFDILSRQILDSGNASACIIVV